MAARLIAFHRRLISPMHRQSGNPSAIDTVKRPFRNPRKSENRANLSDSKEMNSIQSLGFVCGFERGRSD